MKETLRENVASLLPVITEFEKPFWDSLRNKQLLVQKCADCGTVQFPPSPTCSHCLSTKMEWMPCSGKATLWSKVAFHKAYLKPYGDLPYSVALAQLEEGPMITGRISPENAASVPFDGKLRITYAETVDGTVLVEFVPA